MRREDRWCPRLKYTEFDRKRVAAELIYGITLGRIFATILRAFSGEGMDLPYTP
jgi:hypothetical protein